MPLTQVQSGMMDSIAQYNSFKNRIINGAMVIDQRANGAVMNMTGAVYGTCDRWKFEYSAASKFTAQQNAGAVTPPSGFANYLGMTSTSAYTVLTADYFIFSQLIEGFNTADFAWGTVSATTITVSFWVRSSLTGTFGGGLRNNAGNRSYPFTYTVSAANTWEQKSITIPGETTGAWLTNNGIGVNISFSLGTGATYSGTAGAWAVGNFVNATGSTSVVGTNGATLYITGVQLEKGSTATAFDYRPYTTELQLCQRYLPAWTTGGSASSPFGICSGGGATSAFLPLYYPVTPRVYPSGITVSAVNHWQLAGNTTTNMAFNASSLSFLEVAITVASGLASASAYRCFSNTASAYILATGCEL